MIPQSFLQLAVALGLDLLVGLQRERTDSAIAGIRGPPREGCGYTERREGDRP
jgi:hypothetical protein